MSHNSTISGPIAMQHSNHTVKSYDNELQDLINLIVAMAKHVSSELDDAIENWTNPNVSAITKVRDKDRIVNNLDLQIEQKAIKMLALRQPMGIDLRLIVSTIKIAVVLERMGDLSKNITSRACTYSDIKEFRQDLVNLMNNVKLQVERMIELLDINDENENFLKICSKDEEIHLAFKILIDKFENYMVGKSDKTSIQIFTNFIITTRNIERIADCVTKISRICHYIKTGERIGKHQFRVTN